MALGPCCKSLQWRREFRIISGAAAEDNVKVLLLEKRTKPYKRRAVIKINIKFFFNLKVRTINTKITNYIQNSPQESEEGKEHSTMRTTWGSHGGSKWGLLKMSSQSKFTKHSRKRSTMRVSRTCNNSTVGNRLKDFLATVGQVGVGRGKETK